MKIISKTYLLIGILVAVALFNLFILYNTQVTTANESYAIIRAGDLKTKVETIASLASSIAGGNENDRKILDNEIRDFDNILNTLKNGGTIRGQAIPQLSSDISSEYEVVKKNWEIYKKEASQIQALSVHNPETMAALNYVLDKNTEMILTTDSLVKDLLDLNRDYNRHKEIARELHEITKTIGQDAVLISIGQENDTRDSLHSARLSFDVGIRNLLQIPLDDLDLSGTNLKAEQLIPIPRENSRSLDQIDLLWESVSLRVKTLEKKSLFSDEFSKSFSSLNMQRKSLLDSIDSMLDVWNQSRLDERNEGQLVIQAIIGVDIVIFIIVLFVIRKSLLPLQTITNALSRIKEGIYGEKIKYSSSDEIGELASTFNIMSDTIRIKEEEARRMSVAKDEFLTMITHELKTPLVPIQGYADMLLGGHLGTLTDKQRERMGIIKSSATSLLQIISDLLDAQKLELGQLRMKKEVSPIQNTVLKSIQTLQPQIDESKIKVINEVNPKTMVAHDADRITQVLTNLIKNSLKSVKPDVGIIRITSSEDASEVRITVEDNGTGIPPEKQTKLFTKFYQADASLTREKGGSGLGLSICKGIVGAHDGKITLESTPGVGTKVTFSLPKDDGKTPI
ncbi:ATP-binding protein [Candidatus Nitrosotenuis sp. DW1]|uniref:ATP-binding protein n=1 Tax=Candidatus Nitrosotenuis sp. DW1 TaxID=2259672 RepID=UPI0015C966BC|nr:ATP-binding protein [Candidatus Nitrosotenuis sp. DW1]QLH09109.1 two-component sensor histidine kinase [Candidatus Nitrosotenuis sp. DW1]